MGRDARAPACWQAASLGVARVESRSAAALIYASGQDQQPESCLAALRLIFIYHWLESRAILARARENVSVLPLPSLPSQPRFFLAAAFGFRSPPRGDAYRPWHRRLVETEEAKRSRNRALLGGSRSRSEGGSDAGAWTEPWQGAGALRCLFLSHPPLPATVSSLCHLSDSLFSSQLPTLLLIDS